MSQSYLLLQRVSSSIVVRRWILVKISDTVRSRDLDLWSVILLARRFRCSGGP